MPNTSLASLEKRGFSAKPIQAKVTLIAVVKKKKYRTFGVHSLVFSKLCGLQAQASSHCVVKPMVLCHSRHSSDMGNNCHSRHGT